MQILNWLRVIGLGVGLTAAVLGLLLAPSAAAMVLPKVVQEHPVEWGAAAVLAGRLAVEAWGRRREDAGVTRAVARVDGFVGWMLRRGLFLALAGWTIFRMAGWLPHYPYWPWGRDSDAFAETALLWDRGVLPYRDIRSYNFPGHVYIHWALGKLFGWGRPGLYYVADAAALLTLGGVALSWSRRRLGGPLPGTASYFIFLAVYFDMEMGHVAERDWHATLGAVLALMILQARPGRLGRWVAAVPAAAAFATRPHLVLFIPALLYAAWSDGDDATEPGPIRRRAARAAEWAGAFGILAALAFLPLVAAGILDDLVRNLRTAAYGGPYSTLTPARAVTILLEQARQPTTATLAVALATMSVRGPYRAVARAWLLALGGAMVYRPLHPVDHAYLLTVLKLVEAMGWAVPIAWCVRACSADSASGRARFAGLLAVLLLLYETVPMREPYNCSLAASLDALRAAARGGWPDVPPGGAYIWFHPERFPVYPWDDYNRLLRHVRETTGPDTVVANLLKFPPLPPVNGPTGRPSPFRAETGIAWMWLVRQDLDEEFARQLEAAGPDSVVVWAPGEVDAQPRLPLRRTTAVVLRDYEPEARFGPMEVRRRKQAP